MKEKKIAIYLVITIIIFATIIGLTIWMVTGKKASKANDVNQALNNNLQNNNTSNNNNSVEARTIKQTYENSIYVIDLYSDGTATAKIKSNIQLWGDLSESKDEKYKNEKAELKSIFTQSRQVDSNNRKIEEIFISKYIGDIYNNYNYGKAIIKCEGNTFYLLDLTSDKKIRIVEDWTERCREVNSEKIVFNLQLECLKQRMEEDFADSSKIFEGVSKNEKCKYVVSFLEDGTYSLYVYFKETDEVLFYGLGKNDMEVLNDTLYYKFDFVRPEGGNVTGTIKQTKSVSDDINDIIEGKNPISIDIKDFSTDSRINYTTEEYIQLNPIVIN